MKRLKEVGNYKLKRYFHAVLSESEKERIGSYLCENIESECPDIEMLLGGTDPVSTRLRRLFELCGENEIAKTLFELAILLYFDHGAAGALEALGILPEGKNGICILFAAKVCGYSPEDAETLQFMYEAYERVCLFLQVAEGGYDRCRQYFCADTGLLNWISGLEELGDSMKEHGRLLFLPELETFAAHIYALEPTFREFGRKLCVFQKEEPIIAPICGELGSGRKTCAKLVALEFHKPLLLFPYATIVATADLRGLLKELIRTCYLHDAICCLTDVQAQGILHIFLQEWKERADCLGTPLLLTCQTEVKLLPFFENAWELKLDPPEYEQSVRIWEGLLSEHELEGAIPVERVASKMRLTPGQIYLVVKNLKRYLQQRDLQGQMDSDASIEEKRMDSDASRKEIPEAELYRICYQILDDSRYENVKRVKSGFHLEDLMISDRNKDILKRVCDQVTNRETVYRSWGMGRKYTYGRCVSLLLAGPPGTGKTMAVHALASELGLELYKVDLAQITDKYVGESQKRLEEVFARAEKSNLILFFDEADAVLGKRSETKESHDKYANGEISYILQRIEEYDGIVVLATNYIQNIDSAFMRRIRYVVNFEKPLAETRKEIWISAFAENVPRAADIDFDFLAEKFELSGGNIKNIVLNAVFQAAAEKSPVNMLHIMQAIYLENSKDKRISFTTDYGPYGAFLR